MSYSKLFYLTGIGLAKTVLVPEYKNFLDEYRKGAGNAAEILLNNGRVKTFLKGNATKLDVFQKVLDTAGVKIDGPLNEAGLIEEFAIVMEKKRKENKLGSFLLSLKSALKHLHRDNNGGMYFGII